MVMKALVISGIGIMAAIIVFSALPTAQAELWELIVEVNVEKGAIVSGETVSITGQVVDHAYEPIRGGEVLIRTGTDTIKAFTNPDGIFYAEFENFQRVPGTYKVNVIATWYGMTGLDSTEFQVKGETSQISILQQQLSTEQARKYLSANEDDFEKDPIGQTLFKYYHGLLEKLILEKKESLKPNLEQIYIDEQRQIAEELKNEAISEYNPGAGTYEGYKYEYYIASLDPKIRDLVTNQLNFTKNNFEEAQKIRDQILADGGTYEEARQAYLELVSIPKEVLEKFNQEQFEVTPEQQTESSE